MLKFVIPVACTYGKRCVTNLKHEVFFDCFPYEWRSGTSDGIFLPIYPPRRMRIVKEICPRGNNKAVIYTSLYHGKCLLFMLEI